jgi:hypothetical protein
MGRQKRLKLEKEVQVKSKQQPEVQLRVAVQGLVLVGHSNNEIVEYCKSAYSYDETLSDPSFILDVVNGVRKEIRSDIDLNAINSVVDAIGSLKADLVAMRAESEPNWSRIADHQTKIVELSRELITRERIVSMAMQDVDSMIERFGEEGVERIKNGDSKLLLEGLDDQ